MMSQPLANTAIATLIFSKDDTSTASGTLIDFEHGAKVFSVQFPDKSFRHTSRNVGKEDNPVFGTKTLG